MVISIALLVVAAGLFSVEATGEKLEREYGTDPGRTWYPESAIDTPDAPNIVLNASDADDAPLHAYRLNERTWFLFGNIAETDAYNRGWNGNAGFVVTDDAVVVIDALGTPKLGERLIATIKSVTDKPIRYLYVPLETRGYLPLFRSEMKITPS